MKRNTTACYAVMPVALIASCKQVPDTSQQQHDSQNNGCRREHLSTIVGKT
ncbi:hypothetical protein [Chitinophaga sp. MM2321]|uniref:hypothetical protein n=1 Tax=Chitinophaga sp. MM2321 TaxID=3137178 RepID=UPI0032D57AA3